MTTTERSLAEERLLDAELQQLFAEDARAVVLQRRSGWGAAAVVLLGLTVAISVWWVRTSPGTVPALSPAQDPASEPLPEPVSATASTIADVPDDVQNLECDLLPADRMAEFARFRHLRRIVLKSAPFAETSRQLTDKDLAPLVALPALTDLGLRGAGCAVTVAMLPTLDAMPALRALELRECHIDATTIARLARLELRSLRLDGCAVDAPKLGALAALPSLRVLQLSRLGRTVRSIPSDRESQEPPGLDAFGLLGMLPQLEDLLVGGDCPEDLITVLPRSLTRLDVIDVAGLSEASLRCLAEFPRLKELRVRLTADSAEAYAKARAGELDEASRITGQVGASRAKAFAEGLSPLHLRRLAIYNLGAGHVGAAVAAQPELEHLSLTNGIDFDALRPSSSLRTIRCYTMPPQGSLAALRDIESLRRLEVGRYVREEFEAARELLGDRIEVVHVSH